MCRLAECPGHPDTNFHKKPTGRACLMRVDEMCGIVFGGGWLFLVVLGYVSVVLPVSFCWGFGFFQVTF